MVSVEMVTNEVRRCWHDWELVPDEGDIGQDGLLVRVGHTDIWQTREKERGCRG